MREILPVHVAIKERYRLTRPESSKETFHLVLDLQNTPLEYEVGDCIGIYPFNDPSHVSLILDLLKASGEETVLDRENSSSSFRFFLEKKANLTRATKKLLELFKSKAGPNPKLATLESLLSQGSKDPLKNYLEQTHVYEVLSEYSDISITPQELCLQLSPMIPRFYSIASSRYAVGPELHLTVGVTRYQAQEEERTGVCSHFLCHMAPLSKPIIPIFLHKAREFVLSEKAMESPMIMIGPGTGVAPFRGFMQERILKSSCNKTWLFFGERHRAYDFYYEDYWTSLVNAGKLKLDLAFSRDQPHKIYVQHKMLDNAKTLWQWIQEGAFIFVCGDASRMAKDVESTLLQIFREQGGKTPEEASAFLKDLRLEKRYLRDVY